MKNAGAENGTRSNDKATLPASRVSYGEHPGTSEIGSRSLLAPGHALEPHEVEVRAQDQEIRRLDTEHLESIGSARSGREDISHVQVLKLGNDALRARSPSVV
jgi:hypothetical protein